jgi:hypothetical protein
MTWPKPMSGPEPARLASAVHAVNRASATLPSGHDAQSWLRFAERLVREALTQVTDQLEPMHVDNGLLVRFGVPRALCGADVAGEPYVPPETPVTCPGCAPRCGLTAGQPFTRMSPMFYDLSVLAQVLRGLIRRPGPHRWTPRPRRRHPEGK